jgi:acyl dehydratase
MGRKRGGATLLVRYDTWLQAPEAASATARGEILLCTTWTGTFYRGAELLGDCGGVASPPLSIPALLPPPPALAPPVQGTAAASLAGQRISLAVAASEAHVYSECARIWNPIHTDSAFAAAAGLPGIILHGTATLARAVSWILDRFCGGDPSGVVRVAVGTFGAMVFMPSTVTLVLLSATAECVRFEVLNEAGEQAIRGGELHLRAIIKSAL